MQLRSHIVLLQIIFTVLACISIPAFAVTAPTTYLSPVSMFNNADLGGIDCHPFYYPDLSSAQGASTACRDLQPGSSEWTSDWVTNPPWGSQFFRYYQNGLYGGRWVLVQMLCPLQGDTSSDYPGWCLIHFHTINCSPLVLDPSKGLCVAPPERSAGKPLKCQCLGDPINPSSGNSYEETTDFRGSGPFPLVFSRSYNSALANETYNLTQAAANENMGVGWSSNIGTHLYIGQYSPQELTTPCIAYSQQYFCPPTYLPNGDYTIELTVWHADGSQEQFNYQVSNGVVPMPGTPFNAEPGSSGELTFVNLPAPLSGTGYEYLRNDGYTEFYDANGNLLAVQDPHGLMQTYQYVGGGLVTSVTDPFGRMLRFTYDSNYRIKTMTTPTGGIYTYSYDSHGNLVSVTYPDNSMVQYQYQNASYKNAMTRVIDENGNQYATWTYDSQGRAIASQQANNTNSFSIVYNADGSADVTEPTGEHRHMTFTPINDENLFSTASAPCTECGDKSQSIGYDSNGYMNSVTDFNGNINQYSHDTAGRLLSETDAYGTPVQRTISTQWDPVRNLPSLITEPGRTTSYDRQPSVWTTTVTDTSTQISRTTTYNYNGQGLLASIKGPRTDVNQTTAFTYDSAGDIATITNALGEVTQITSYDNNGYPLTIVDPNGVTTTLTYDGRQRLLSRTVAGVQTTFTYDKVGNLTQVTLPTGAYLSYTYDPAHRLTAISDNYNDTITYVLDNLGNRVQEQTTDPSHNLQHLLQRTYDNLNHLLTVTGGANQVTHYTEDLIGNTTRITDPLNHSYTQGFDALNRLKSVLDPYSDTTSYTYDALSRVTKVKDPRTLNTQYTYDGFDDLTQLASPDTGTSTSTYDLDGDRLTQTDARGVTTQYSYDALDRLTSISYPHPSLNVSFTYDQGTDGIGHLTGIQDASGTISYAYNARGDVTQKTQTINGHAFKVSYGYDNADNLTSITYPDLTQVLYTRDAAERITAIKWSAGGPPKNVATGITYEPFGPITGLTYGNGLTETRTYDQDYRLTSLTDPNTLSWQLGYNADDDITGITDQLISADSQTLGYDNVNRLTGASASGLYGTLSYGYDANGNRNTETLSGTRTTFNISTTSNQLVSLSGGLHVNYSYDANGNISSDGTHTYTYDDTNRLTLVDSGSTATYLYNALGQRVEKTAGSTTTVYVYDEAGHLLGEYTTSGIAVSGYVWLNDTPVGVVKAATLYFVHTDQLGTPRDITNSSQQVVWQWRSDPFGTSAPTGSLTYNLRIPRPVLRCGNWAQLQLFQRLRSHHRAIYRE